MSRHAFYPYRAFPGAIELHVEPQGAEPGSNAGEERILLYSMDAREVTLDVKARLDERILQQVVPPVERSSPPVAALLVLQSLPARQRWSVNLTGVNGTYSGQLVLRMRDYFGTAQLQAFLVRTSTNSRLPGGYARDRGAILATSEVVELFFDEPPAPPTGGHLPIRWLDFAHSTIPWLRQQPENVFALDVAGNPPVLYLNSALQGVRNTLDTRATHGRQGRIRDLTFGLIAHQVWTSLLATALAALAPREEERPDFNDLPDWQQAVITQWLPDLYPGFDSHEDRLEQLYNDLTRDDWARELLVLRVPDVLQRRMDTGLKVIKAATEDWRQL